MTDSRPEITLKGRGTTPICVACDQRGNCQTFEFRSRTASVVRCSWFRRDPDRRPGQRPNKWPAYRQQRCQ